ncbi:helix-turn-helix transcriptional regulator, partial [Microvirga tunisiensis]
MSRKDFEQTIEFIQDLDRAKTPAEVCGMLLSKVRKFGAEYILAGTMPSPGTSREQQISNIILDHWPIEWSRRYFAHGYVFRDPAIRGVTANMRPFMWEELEPLYRDDQTAWRVMDEAGDFRLKRGFTIPLVTLEGDIAGFSLAGEKLEVSPADRGMLTLLATYALGRSFLLRADDGKPMRSLSSREQEALQWAAEGKSEWETGEIMGISEHGCSATRECVSKATARFTRCRLRLKSTYRVTGRHGGAHEPARSGGSHDYQGIGGAG